VPPQSIFLTREEWAARLGERSVRAMTPFEPAGEQAKGALRSFAGRVGYNFAADRSAEGRNGFHATVAHLRSQQAQGRRVIIAAFTPGARERLSTLLTDHKLPDTRKIESYAEAQALPAHQTALAVLALEQGFETHGLAVIAEQDILGDRLVRPRRKA